MAVTITAVSPQPRVDLRSTDAQTGEPVRITRYRGVARIELQKAGGGFAIVAVGDTALSFFLPDSVALPRGTTGTVSASVSVALQPISGGPNTDNGPYGVHSVAGRLTDDPGGGDATWVQLDFVHTYATTHTEVAYDVTVVVPLTPPT